MPTDVTQFVTSLQILDVGILTPQSAAGPQRERIRVGTGHF